jgi:hypothetical protein
MEHLRKLIKEVLSSPPKKDACNCGCHSCDNVGNTGVVLNESLVKKEILSENLRYHVDKQLPLTENTFRYGSQSFLNLWAEARSLYLREIIHVNEDDKEILEETDLGNFGMYENQKVPLDLLLLENEELEEAEDKKKNPPLGKPKRGGSKKFYVYVKNPQTKKIKKISFGDTTGLSAKINNPKARKAFAARHDCKNKTDKTKASYWSCRLPRYASFTRVKIIFSGFLVMNRLEKLINEVLSEEKEKRDRCLRIADRKFDKPSAYKSGAVVRCRKGGIWKGLKEELLLEKVKETLRTWFSRKGAPGKKGGWVDCNTCREVDGKTKCKACGREKGETRSKYPSCRPTAAQCKTPGKGKKWGKTK